MTTITMNQPLPMSELATIQFVGEVEKYPFLYNRKEYVRKDIVDKAWHNIGKQFNMSGLQSREKWKNIRTSYARYLKHPHLNPSSTRTKPYYLEDAMRFARPFVEKSLFKRTSNLPSNITTVESTEDNDMNEDVQVEEYPIEYFQVKSPRSSRDSSVGSPTQPEINETSDSVGKIEVKCIESLKEPKVKSELNVNLTQRSRKMFLLSLLPDVYAMSDVQMRIFKMKVITLINEMM